MQVNFKARNMEISESIIEYAIKRLSKFDKLIGADEAFVTMRSIKDRYRVEVSIPYHGITIRGEEEGYDMYACIDLVTDKLESQIHKYRSRLIKRGRNRDTVPPVETVADEWVEDVVPVREKNLFHQTHDNRRSYYADEPAFAFLLRLCQQRYQGC